MEEELAARLDKDEAEAKERRGIFPSPAVEDSGAVWLHVKRGGNAAVAHYLHPVEGWGDMADLRAWADADQGWTQDRALRYVEAVRAIITEIKTGGGNTWSPDYYEGLNFALLRLAEMYDED